MNGRGSAYAHRPLTTAGKIDDPALELELRAIAREVPSDRSRRRAILALVIVVAIGLVMIVGAFGAMSGLRESAWETTGPAGEAQTVAAEAAPQPELTPPLDGVAPATPVDSVAATPSVGVTPPPATQP